MAQESFDFFRAHFLRMADPMKADITLDPVDINALSARAVTVGSEGFSNSVEQFGLLSVGQNPIFHAVFVANLPSKGQEIDCMIQVSTGDSKDLEPFFAAFVDAVPSKGPEIDCRLQSNSR